MEFEIFAETLEKLNNRRGLKLKARAKYEKNRKNFRDINSRIQIKTCDNLTTRYNKWR
jgi:hypothetical protein